MAAIDLERGLEHSGWGQERPELMDNFDSEMQEWEDQLQDIQRKIEELYTEVQARRGTNDVTSDSQKNSSEIDCELGRNGSLFATDKTHQQYSNSCNGYSHHNGYGYCQNNGIHEIGDILQDYLGQGKPASRKNNGARHVHFSDTIKVSSDLPLYQDDIKTRTGSARNGQEQFFGSFVENENKKNRVTQVKSKEGLTNKENGGGKPPFKQRETQPRPGGSVESPALERKCFGLGGLVDMKGSPSVLRKFGAMLHENEGKLLTESGVVSPPSQTTEPKCPTPSCQRKALGGRMPGRVPTQKCQADCDVQTAEAETSQERPPATDCGRQNHKDQRGGYSAPKGQPSPQQSQRRAQVQGSPKPRPRAQSGTDKDRARRTAVHQGEFKMDHTGVNGSPVAVKKRIGLRDEGLIELLDMLDIQHEYSNGTTYRQDTEPDSTDVLTAKPKSFSRPARPANQRPPSRWASCTPSARISTPSGPMYRPPSPLTRTHSPLTRPPSPALKHRNFMPYSLHTETVIM
ncbi:uncharacterized protein LOC117393013 [Periophthalmus magnuspinnatus]|uniref:uncharacterized protein LOC117393013 n=1 Tax=Periophthalmus magnuspinnatus TaxID=409849 RepID=UPI00145BB057|nr:uncharacterized protein LOC117393013 [Periophthalmus magnuspinnatus]XP_055088291.1 uncharacterized protein LOC117393013 [Periophthalmus magnuspinnatus]